jgi:hypothetical protein
MDAETARGGLSFVERPASFREPLLGEQPVLLLEALRSFRLRPRLRAENRDHRGKRHTHAAPKTGHLPLRTASVRHL